MDTGGYIGNIQIDDTEAPPLELIKVKLTGPNGQPVQVLALPDTGASINAISAEIFRKTGNELCPEAADPPSSPDGSKMKTIGKTQCVIELQNQRMEVTMVVIEGLITTIIGRNALKGLGLIPASFPHMKEEKTGGKNESTTGNETRPRTDQEGQTAQPPNTQKRRRRKGDGVGHRNRRKHPRPRPRVEQIHQPLTDVEQVPSEPSVTLAKPEAKNIRPNRQKKPIVRSIPNQNRYYEP